MTISQPNAGRSRASRMAPGERGHGHLNDLLRVTHALAQLDDIRAILRLLNQTIVETLDCDRSVTFITSGDHVALIESFGASDADLDIYRSEAYQRVAARVSAWLAHSRRPLVVNGPPFPSALTPRLADGLEIRSFVVIPLFENDQLVGALTAAHTRDQVAFTAEDVAFIEGLASHAVVALRRARLGEALRRSEERYRLLVEQAQDIIFTLDREGRFGYLSGSVRRVLGYRPEDLIGRRFGLLIPPSGLAAAERRFRAALAGGTVTPPFECDVVRQDGTLARLEVTLGSLTGSDGIVGRHGIARDVTERFRLLKAQTAERRRTRTALCKEQAQRARAETLLQIVTAAASTLSVRKTLIQVCSAVARLSVAERCSIFLYDEEADRYQPIMSLGIDDPALWERFRTAPTRPAAQMAHGFAEARRTKHPHIEPHVPGSGVVDQFWIDAFQMKALAIYPMVVRDRVVGMMTVDSPTQFIKFPREEVQTMNAIAQQAAIIIENARLFERVQRQAQTDFLTNLPNHRYLQDLFAQMLANAERDGDPLGVAMVDIDNFKQLNDLHGHQAGDAALREVATAIRSALRAVDVVGRYGGDEFLVLLPGYDRDATEQILAATARRLEQMPIAVPDRGWRAPLHITWGVAAYPTDGAACRDLISRADAALIERKLCR
jgi:diguanylate cyclase (GGDEF)-like protein/PAS domain S-box-containing protein